MFVMMMERKRENRAVENDVLILDFMYIYVCMYCRLGYRISVTYFFFSLHPHIYLLITLVYFILMYIHRPDARENFAKRYLLYTHAIT